MSRLIFIIESNLVWFVIGIALLGLLVPASGQFLDPAIGLMRKPPANPSCFELLVFG